MVDRKKKGRRNKVEHVEEYQSNAALPLFAINFKAMNEKQKELFSSIHHNVMTIAIGPPGTAKTFVSCAAALSLIKSNPKIEKIYLIKSVTPLEGEDIGFLKGSLEQKMDPFVFSFRHNIEKLIGKKVTDILFQIKKIEVLPMAYLRGVSLENCVVLIDEGQNINVFNMRTALTRIGENSKVVVLGDTKQIDLKYKEKSVLEKVYHIFDDIDGIGRVKFEKEDIVRSKLVQYVEDLFDENFPNNK